MTVSWVTGSMMNTLNTRVFLYPRYGYVGFDFEYSTQVLGNLGTIPNTITIFRVGWVRPQILYPSVGYFG